MRILAPIPLVRTMVVGSPMAVVEGLIQFWHRRSSITTLVISPRDPLGGVRDEVTRMRGWEIGILGGVMRITSQVTTIAEI